MKVEKVYCVTFMRYTNALKDTVSDWDGDIANTSSNNYLHVEKEPFLLKESDLPKYQIYGGGFRNLVFVGNLPVD